MAVIGSLLIRMGADARPMMTELQKGEAAVARFAAKAQAGGGESRGAGGFGLGALAGGAAGAATAAVSAGIGLAGDLASKAGSSILAAIGRASDLNETLSKTGTIFGPAADVIIGKAGEMSAKFGTDRAEYINAATSFGAVFKGMGKSQQDAAALGNTLAKLGMDMASFDNASNSEVFTALQAGLRGEFDPLERFRVFLSADKVAAKALEMGLAATKKELDDNAKKTAMLALIMEQTKDAQGDLARTAGGAANQFRMFSGRIANLSTDLGMLLLPAVQSAMVAFNDMLGSAVNFFESSKPMLVEWAGVLKMGIDEAIQVLGSLPDAFELIQIGIVETLGNVASWFGSNFVNVILMGLTTVGDSFRTLTGNVTGLWEAASDFMQGKGFHFEPAPMVNSFKSILTSLPELGTHGDAFQGKLAEIQDKAARRLVRKPAEPGEFVGPPKPLVGPPKPGTEPSFLESFVGPAKPKGYKAPDTFIGPPKPAGYKLPGEDGAPEYHATAAVKFGTQEFASAITKHANGGVGDDKPIKTVAKNSADHLVEARTQTQIWRDIKDSLADVGRFNAASL